MAVPHHEIAVLGLPPPPGFKHDIFTVPEHYDPASIIPVIELYKVSSDGKHSPPAHENDPWRAEPSQRKAHRHVLDPPLLVRRKVIKQEIDGVLHVYKLQWVIYRVNSEDERSEVLSSVDALVYMQPPSLSIEAALAPAAHATAAVENAQKFRWERGQPKLLLNQHIIFCLLPPDSQESFDGQREMLARHADKEVDNYTCVTSSLATDMYFLVVHIVPKLRGVAAFYRSNATDPVPPNWRGPKDILRDLKAPRVMVGRSTLGATAGLHHVPHAQANSSMGTDQARLLIASPLTNASAHSQEASHQIMAGDSGPSRIQGQRPAPAPPVPPKSVLRPAADIDTDQQSTSSRKGRAGKGKAKAKSKSGTPLPQHFPIISPPQPVEAPPMPPSKDLLSPFKHPREAPMPPGSLKELPTINRDSFMRDDESPTVPLKSTDEATEGKVEGMRKTPTQGWWDATKQAGKAVRDSWSGGASPESTKDSEKPEGEIAGPAADETEVDHLQQTPQERQTKPQLPIATEGQQGRRTAGLQPALPLTDPSSSRSTRRQHAFDTEGKELQHVYDKLQKMEETVSPELRHGEHQTASSAAADPFHSSASSPLQPYTIPANRRTSQQVTPESILYPEKRLLKPVPLPDEAMMDLARAVEETGGSPLSLTSEQEGEGTPFSGSGESSDRFAYTSMLTPRSDPAESPESRHHPFRSPGDDDGDPIPPAHEGETPYSRSRRLLQPASVPATISTYRSPNPREVAPWEAYQPDDLPRPLRENAETQYPPTSAIQTGNVPDHLRPAARPTWLQRFAAKTGLSSYSSFGFINDQVPRPVAHTRSGAPAGQKTAPNNGGARDREISEGAPGGNARGPSPNSLRATQGVISLSTASSQSHNPAPARATGSSAARSTVTSPTYPPAARVAPRQRAGADGLPVVAPNFGIPGAEARVLEKQEAERKKKKEEGWVKVFSPGGKARKPENDTSVAGPSAGGSGVYGRNTMTAQAAQVSGGQGAQRDAQGQLVQLGQEEATGGKGGGQKFCGVW